MQSFFYPSSRSRGSFRRYVLWFLSSLVISLQAYSAAVSVPKSQYTVSIVPGYNHQNIIVPFEFEDAGFDGSGLSVSTDVDWATPAIDLANQVINIAFSTTELISSYTATISLSDGTETVEIFLSAQISPFDVYRLLDDPYRSRMYGIHRNGYSTGAIFALDPISGDAIACLTVGKAPSDMAISRDGSELFVISSHSETIEVIDLASFTLKEVIPLPYYTKWGDETTANIELGPANKIYYIDAAWGPTLHVLDRASRSIVQSLQYESNTGFQDIAITPDQTRMIALPQYGWSSGSHSSTYAVLSVASNGHLTIEAPISHSSISRDPFEAPILISSDGAVAFGKNLAIDLNEVDSPLTNSANTVWAISPGGEIVASGASIYDLKTGNVLLPLEGVSEDVRGTYNYIGTRAGAFTSDYARYIYYNPNSRKLVSKNLIEELGTSILGTDLAPAEGAVVTSPSELRWTPLLGLDRYAVYLGSDQAAVNAATPDSPEFLGQATGSSLSLNSVLAAGKTYYWRVDPVSDFGTEKGPLRSFKVSTIALSEKEVTVETVAGHANYGFEFEVTAPTNGQSWTATADDTWVRLTETSGTTPSTLSLELDASDLAPGFYFSAVKIQSGSDLISIPVELTVAPLVLTKLETVPGENIVYGISEDTGDSSAKAHFLEIDAESEKILRVVEVGESATDIAVHLKENRIYITNWYTGGLLALDRDTLEIERVYPTNSFAGTGYSSGDVYVVSPGAQGRLILEEEDQWVDVSIFDTSTGEIIDRTNVREGGGQSDSTGRYYYHGENNSSGAAIKKFDLTGDTLTQVSSIRPSEMFGYYGSRILVLSGDGSRVFWAGVAFDSDLEVEWYIGEIIYATSFDGRYAFGQNNIYDINVKRAVYAMPSDTTVMAYNDESEKLVVPDSVSGLSYISLSDPLVLTAPLLELVSITNESAVLRWSDRTLETSFEMQYRKAGESSWTSGGSTERNIITATISGLSELTPYEFRIRALTDEVSSPWSELVAASTTSTPPMTPSIRSNTRTSSSIYLSFTASGDFDELILERSQDYNGAWDEITRTPSGVSTYIDEGLSESTTYYYRAKLTKGDLESGYSSIISVATRTLYAPNAPYREFEYQKGTNSIVIGVYSSSEIDTYILQYRELGSPWQNPYIIESEDPVFTITGLEIGTQYEFRLAARNVIGQSSYSNVDQFQLYPRFEVFEEDFDEGISTTVWANGLYFTTETVTPITGAASLVLDPGDFLRSLALGVNSLSYVEFTATASDGSALVNGELRVFTYETNDSHYSSDLPLHIGGNRWATTLYTNSLGHFGISNRGDRTILIDDIKVTASSPPTESTPPPYVLAIPLNSTSVLLQWPIPLYFDPAQNQDPTNAFRFIIERRTPEEPWTAIASVPSTSEPFYVDVAAPSGSDILYRISTQSAIGISAPSISTYTQTMNQWAEWALEQYGDATIEMSNERDSLGMSPLSRFAFGVPEGVHPLKWETSEMLPKIVRETENGSFCVEFRQRMASTFPEIAYSIEVSTDMIIWEQTDAVLIETQLLDGPWELATYDLGLPDDYKFVRVSVVGTEER